jgi:hypothetical protein
VCNAQGLGASSDDLGHDVRFAPVNLLRQRGFVGLWARYGLFAPTPRVATRPTRASKERRLSGKRERGTIKRGRVVRDWD